VLGVLAALGLFAGVLLHELGHSLVAMHYGYEIDSIKLWILGGIAQFTEIPKNWKQELSVALAGPIVSIVLGVLSYAAFLAIPGELAVVQFLAGYLAVMNVALAGFNLLPGFPMDGGRVLRALLARNRPYVRATKIAAEIGKVFAFLLGLFGLLGFNIILIAVAFFIYMGASGEAQQVMLKATFEGVTVEDLMTPADRLKTVSADASVAELMERMLRERHTGYPVTKDGWLTGIVTLSDVQSVPEIERDAYRIEDVMTHDVETVTPGTGAMDALQTMQQHSIGRLPVVSDDDDERLVGLISRTDLLTAFDIGQTGDLLESVGRNRASIERG
jgi:Zn-dependent protease/predicted transcriptional regulator